MLFGPAREAFDAMGLAVRGGKRAVDDYVHDQGLAARRRSVGPGLRAGAPPQLTIGAAPTAFGHSDPYGATKHYSVQREDGSWVRALNGRPDGSNWAYTATNGFPSSFPNQKKGAKIRSPGALEYLKWLTNLELHALLTWA
jgi:hypothetical protein